MMELTLDQALKKGIEAHKAGQVTEADRYYTAILKAKPKHPAAFHNWFTTSLINTPIGNHHCINTRRRFRYILK